MCLATMQQIYDLELKCLNIFYWEIFNKRHKLAINHNPDVTTF